ncbi:MAG: exodeoxyribonuclease V subunit alpha, partial [Chromatiales bacterium]|nr:exodeoxyribonuclease V subunit alpha [Chromatiales bacterium]
QRLSTQQASGDSCIPINEDERALILRSGLVNGDDVAPLVIEDERLYLYRYWAYEERLATQIKTLIRSTADIDESLLNRYFKLVSDLTDWQREAAHCVLSNSLTIITGGPGTGKTTTVVKIVAMLQEQAHSDGTPLNIALAAPTGKAAMRLQQSMAGSIDSLPCDSHIRESIPSKVSTIHRLLGAKRYSPYFRRRADNPLPHDLIVVDEASMVDLALMSKLVDALKRDAKLILLGDRNQLASVESGAVLADLIEALPEQTAELKESFRFDSSIKAVADGVNDQQGEPMWGALQQGLYPEVRLLNSSVIEQIIEKSLDYWQQIRDDAPFTEILATFGKFQCLATNRVGPMGVIDINRRVEERLASTAFIEQNDIGAWYRGRPVIVTRNIRELGLFNGDIGITLAGDDGALRVYFEGTSENESRVRDFIPSRIPHCETAYAMTVHKSQGSEFNEVLVLFPEVMNPVLTKELVYTAITRAKKTVEIVVTKEIWLAAVGQRIARHSGLVVKLSP